MEKRKYYITFVWKNKGEIEEAWRISSTIHDMDTVAGLLAEYEIMRTSFSDNLVIRSWRLLK